MGSIGPLRLFAIRAKVRAYLLAVGEFQTYAEAFAPLLQKAASTGLADEVGAASLTAIIDAACADNKIELEASA